MEGRTDRQTDRQTDRRTDSPRLLQRSTLQARMRTRCKKTNRVREVSSVGGEERLWWEEFVKQEGM